MNSLHNTLVLAAKSGGLIYLILLSIAVIAYVYWPSNRQTFDAASTSILNSEDRPNVSK